MRHNYPLVKYSFNTLLSVALVLIVASNVKAQMIQVNESFDLAGPYPANNLPFGWAQGKVLPSADPENYFDRMGAGAFNPNCSPRSGAGMLRYRSFYTVNVNEAAFVASRPFDLRNRGALSSNFRFWIYRDEGFPGINDNIQVYINTTPSITGATLLTDTANASNIINRPCASVPAVPVGQCALASYNATKWNLYGYTIPNLGWNLATVYVIIRGTNQSGNNIYIDDFSIDTYPQNQSITSYGLDQQNVANVGLGTQNQWIGAAKIVANGEATSYRIDSLNFATTGSTQPLSDITRARLYWTGGSGIFDATIAQLIGAQITPVTSTNLTFFPVATFRLNNGDNYFWITYDITAAPAAGGRFVDAEFIGFTNTLGAAGNGIQAVPSPGTLAGAREIDLPYCIPTYTTGTSWNGYFNNDYIASVILNGEAGYPVINNTLNSNGLRYQWHPPDYERFAPGPGKTTALKADGTTSYNLNAQVGTYIDGNCLAAWIDFNHDGDFIDAGEKILQTNYCPPPGPTCGTPAANYIGNGNNGWTNANFTVPSTAYVGNTTLRVREVWINGNINPCQTYTYGETEDYTITIIPDCNLIPALAGWSIWLGGFSDDWNVVQNWCGGVPTLLKDAIVIDSATVSQAYLGGAPSPLIPIYAPVIKPGINAQTRKLRIQGTDSVTLNGYLNSSLTIADSLNITNAAGKLKVVSAYADTISISNGNTVNTNVFPFSAGFNKRRMWLNYTQAELLAKGFVANDVIDTLIFLIRTRASTVPYNNLTISYYYTTSGACFPAAAAGVANPPLPVLVAGGVIFGPASPQLNVAGQYFVPAGGGQLKIPLNPNSLIWNGSANNLVIEMCYDNPANSLNDQSYYTPTIGCNSFYAISQLAGATAGCSLLNNTAGAIRYSSSNRPNITFKFHRSYIKYPINIRGHWGNNGTFVRGNSIVTFNGAAIQNIDGTSNTTFHELAVNNNANVRQNTAATVEDTLWLTTGRLLLNTRTLTLNNNLAGAITRTNGYLFSEDLPPNYGRIRWQIGANTSTRDIPFITALGVYIPFTYLPVSGTSDFTIGTYRTIPANTPWPTGVTNINNYSTGLDNSANMVDRFWIIDNAGVSPVADMTFRFAAAEAPGAGAVSSQRWVNVSGWQPYTPGQTSTATSNFSPGISIFATPWTLTLTPQPLPIELLTFTAEAVGNKVKLDWVTATEVDNDYFTVERTKDARSFEDIVEVRSQGPSTSNQYYTTFDYKPLKGLQYYRLKQTDFNGKFTYSDIVPVYFGKDISFEIVTVVNNDDNSFTVVFKYDSNEPYSYKIMDVTGRIITSENGKQASPGTNIFDVNASIPSGVYTIIIQNSYEVISRKIFR